MKKAGGSKFVFVVESQNRKNGLGSRFGSWLLERGFTGRYGYMGSVRQGDGGVSEQVGYQGLSPEDIKKKIRSLL